MIRIDYKRFVGEGVETTWVREMENRHILMGRMLFTEKDFNDIMEILINNPFGLAYKFEEKG